MKKLVQILALLIPLGASAQLIIETETSWNGSEYIQPFGESNTATYGQTFLTDSTNLSLNTIEFHLDHKDGIDAIDFAVYVTKWDGTKATGPILFQSSQQTLSAGGDWTEFSLSTGGTSLEANENYVFFFSASDFFDGDAGLANAGSSDVYNDGNFVFLNNGSNFDALFSGSWTQWSDQDLAFRLEFSPVPEPATIGILSMGALGAILLVRRRIASRKQK